MIPAKLKIPATLAVVIEAAPSASADVALGEVDSLAVALDDMLSDVEAALLAADELAELVALPERTSSQYFSAPGSTCSVDTYLVNV